MQKRDENQDKMRWLDELRSLGIKPVVVILGYAATLGESLALEREWIRRGIQAEWPLTNVGMPKRHRYQFRGASATKPVKIPKPLAKSLNAWHRWTLDNYLPAHLELLQTDDRGRGIGIKALAEATAAECGKDVDAMKGTASEVAKRLRNTGGAK